MKYFKTQELVSQSLYAQLGDRAIRLFEPQILAYLDDLRVKWGKALVINNWASGGTYNQSGLRELNSKVGAVRSKHKEGFAFDIKTSDLKEFYDFVIKTPGLNIIRVENFKHTPTWVHVELGENKGLPRVFNP